jgi:hypothetical protein
MIKKIKKNTFTLLTFGILLSGYVVNFIDLWVPVPGPLDEIAMFIVAFCASKMFEQISKIDKAQRAFSTRATKDRLRAQIYTAAFWIQFALLNGLNFLDLTMETGIFDEVGISILLGTIWGTMVKYNNVTKGA